MVDFYDKVAKKFGGYGYGNGTKAQYKSEYPAGDPEKIFKEKLLELSSKDKTALDIGCADGKFTLSVAPYFKKVYGIDTSRINLDIAKRHNWDERSKNVEYYYQNAKHASFENSFFDIAYCRRGPTFYEEYHRILKTKGYYLEIGIGEKDTVELKGVFGRGQGYGTQNQSRLDKDKNEFALLGFTIIFARDYSYNEYYDSISEFDRFLQGVPIFEDYDSKQDGNHLKAYCEKFATPKGILLPRQRVVYVVQK